MFLYNEVNERPLRDQELLNQPVGNAGNESQRFNRECIYDAGAKEAQIRDLKSENERLEEELEAATVLLKQVAIGPDYVRSLVLQYLADNNQPLEILELLKSQEKSRVWNTNCKSEEMSDADGSAFPEETDGSYKEETPVIQTEEPDLNKNMMGLETAGDASRVSSILYASLSATPEDSTGNTPGYTPLSFDGIGYSTLSQTCLPSLETPAVSTTNMAASQFTSSAASHQQTAIPYRPSCESLFFEPLFKHSDFYLSTSATAPIQQDAPNGHHWTTNMENQQQFQHQGQPYDSSLSSFDGPDPTISEQTTKEVPPSSLHINPNYQNNFGNLTLSSSVRTNGYPLHIQEAQIRNIFVPDWAVTSLNTVPDPGGLEEAFRDIYKEATRLLKEGVPASRITGRHPNIAALYDQSEFDKSCLVSQWAARMVHSVKLHGYDFTCFASMNVFWYVMRWMIDPSPETYAAMPEWIRPTASQLFTPHISMADFVLWPAFRELVVQFPQMQEHMAWLADMSIYIKCEWPYELELALKRDPVSGDVDLSDLAKV
ncbi:Nitrogen assimilation transcription factor nit-4 [Fusarium austroafricanum]|uniref:Nitrogen assimilation transcription factor nit-4 n=1 Tax=Fusarium austroafricanum TaxID=2364996 RepID=A0A8H4KML0_9HYPO|nr:Nitrogen assimilation transcription factor nit-4 [Fusarium austroafricanum]